MKIHWILRLSLIIALVAIAAEAATVRKLSLDALIEQSDHVVYARAVGRQSFWDDATATIWTQTEFLVLDSAKGHAGRTLLVSEPGGVLGSVGHLFPGVPNFEVNQEVVLFLNKDSGGRLRVLGLQQGVYKVEVDRATGERVVQPLVQKQEVMQIDGPTSQTQTKPAQSERGLREFLNLIREKISVR